MTAWVVRNQTPSRLRLVGEDRVLELAPLQATRIAYPPLELGEAAAEAVAEGALAWDTEPVREVRERWAALTLVLAALVACWGAWALVERDWGRATVAATALVACAGVLSLLDRLARDRDRPWRVRRRGGTDEDGDFR